MARWQQDKRVSPIEKRSSHAFEAKVCAEACRSDAFDGQFLPLARYQASTRIEKKWDIARRRSICGPQNAQGQVALLRACPITSIMSSPGALTWFQPNHPPLLLAPLLLTPPLDEQFQARSSHTTEGRELEPGLELTCRRSDNFLLEAPYIPSPDLS